MSHGTAEKYSGASLCQSKGFDDEQELDYWEHLRHLVHFRLHLEP